MVNEEVKRLRNLEIPGTGPQAIPKRRPMSSLLASAIKLTSGDVAKKNRGISNSADKTWQDEAWNMYDLVGEQRFLINTLAGRMAKARLFVGKIDPTNITDDPEEVEDERIVNILTSFGKSPAYREQLIKRLAVNLYIPGDGWLVGVQPELLEQGTDSTESSFDPPETPDPLAQEWFMLSVDEISLNVRGEVEAKLPIGDQKYTFRADDISLIRVWNPHPRWWDRADSPTKSSLPVLKELVGLTLHVSAQVQSRLAGAGLLVVPHSAQQAIRVSAGQDVDEDDDLFTEALITAMLTPIEDRGSASAVVPLVVTAPDDVTDKFNYISFATPLDAEARNLRNEAVRRLALGQDCPPELLLGTAGMNHWGGWLVKEDVVSTHLEPPLALICDALTTQYLWPAMLDVLDMSEEEVHKYVVWYDVSHLIVRPNISADALELHTRGVIGDDALRRTMGFDDDEMFESEMDPAQALAVGMVQANPNLLVSPGIEFLVNELRRVMGGVVDESIEPKRLEDPSGTSAVAEERESGGGAPAQIPQTDTAPAEPEGGM